MNKVVIYERVLHRLEEAAKMRQAKVCRETGIALAARMRENGVRLIEDEDFGIVIVTKKSTNPTH
jgi:hypothetical protein